MPEDGGGDGVALRAVRHARGKKGSGEPLNAKLLAFAELGPGADLSMLDITKMGQDTRRRCGTLLPS